MLLRDAENFAQSGLPLRMRSGGERRIDGRID
jgi:hypothetical protein